MLQIIGQGGMGREAAAYYGGEGMLVVDSEVRPDSLTPTIIAIGDPKVREKISNRLPNLHYTVLNRALCYGNNHIGKGSILCPGAIITTNVIIEDHVIVNLNCTIHHDVVIDDFSTI